MTDISGIEAQLERAKLEGVKQGQREQRLADVENALQEHQERCEEKSDQLRIEVEGLKRMTYIGFGILIAIQTIFMALGIGPGVLT